MTVRAGEMESAECCLMKQVFQVQGFKVLWEGNASSCYPCVIVSTAVDFAMMIPCSSSGGIYKDLFYYYIWL